MTKARKSGKFLILAGILAGITSGLAAGVGGYTFLYAKGTSYLSNNSEVCANCHVMQGNYDSWLKSSHHNVAVCNDCHTPHNLLGKYAVKGINGFRHSTAFTLQNFPDNIQITPFNRAITEDACRYCHQSIVQAIDPLGPHDANATDCLRCHPSVGHLELEQ